MTKMITLSRKYDLIGRKYFELASLAVKSFQDPETHICEIGQINGENRLFHLDISVPFVFTDHNTKTSYIGKEIILGYNQNFKSLGLPFFIERLIRRIGGRKLASRIPRIMTDLGRISYADLYGLSHTSFNIQWNYPSEEVSGRDNYVYMLFEDGNLSNMHGRFTDPGKLDEVRELDDNDPKNLQRILDESEPWLKELVSSRS